MLSMILLILCVAIAVTLKFRLNVNRSPLGVKALPSATSATQEYKTLHNIRCKRRFKAKITLSIRTGCVKLKFPQQFKEQLRKLLCKQKQISLQHCQSELEQRALEHCQSELKQKSSKHCQSELVNEVMAHAKINEFISQSIKAEETVLLTEKKKISQLMVSEDHFSFKHCLSEIGHEDSQKNICIVISQSIVSQESVHSIVKTVGTEENQMPLMPFKSELVNKNVSQEKSILSQSIVIEEMIQSTVSEEIALLMRNEAIFSQETNKKSQSFVIGDSTQTVVNQETYQTIVNQETSQTIVNQEKGQTIVHQETTQSIVHRDESLHQFLSIPGGLVEILQNIRTSLEKSLEKLIIDKNYKEQNSSEESVRNLKRNRTHESLAAETQSLVEVLERSTEQDKKAEVLTHQGSLERLLMPVQGSVGSSYGSAKSLKEPRNSPEESSKALETLFTTHRASQTSMSPFEVDDDDDVTNAVNLTESGDHKVNRSCSVVPFDSQYEFSPSHVSIGFNAGDIPKRWNLASGL